MLAELLTLASLPAAADAVLRWVYARAARKRAPVETSPVRRWIAVVPARDEGARVVATFEALRRASTTVELTAILLLDGEDVVAAEAARALGVEVALKSPAGPSKAAALAWLAERLGVRATDTDAILVLDVGSTVSPDFFEGFGWPDGADAVQAFLVGQGGAVGGAAAVSERAAQRFQDRGRLAFGWNVQLRGTGMAFRPEVFADLFPRLGTRVEDLEATLWLSAAGKKIGFPVGPGVVYDLKPSGIAEAAVQRSRWLAGRFELLVRRAPWIARLLARRPGEGIALLIELLSRPISLTALLRIAAAVTLVLEGGGIRLVAAAVLALTVLMDAIYLGTAQRLGWRDAGRMAIAWIGAVLALPAALFRWMRSRRS